MKKTIRLHSIVGDFAENKDLAKKIRLEEILPALSNHQIIILDFKGITGATQSFIHALLSDPIRQFRDIAFDNLTFKNVDKDVKEIISIVYRYMQESMDSEN